MGIFNKTTIIIPFALVGYEMIIANKVRPTISYPTCTHGIIYCQLSLVDIIILVH